jgi:signal transduction histidine kinase
MPLPLADDAPRLGPFHRHALPDAQRATPERLRQEVARVAASPLVEALLDAADAILLVLNGQRQVVAMNGPRRRDPPIGVRPGDVLGCVNAGCPGGCGTGEACETCGALGAILASQREDRAVAADCQVVTDPGGAALELSVRAAPITVEGERFTALALRDVTVAKRREALEHVFFHDVMNTVTGLRGWAALVARGTAGDRAAGKRVDALSRQLEREIRDHRTLVLAEKGTLVPSPSVVFVRDLLCDVASLFAQHALARDRAIELTVSPGARVEADPALLSRVLVNMVRNALEATPFGGTVRLSCTAEPPGTELRFAVHNPGTIPPEARPRIFQRSFSTKGPGRGLGTYGMKLLGERFLGGRVSFTTSEEAGTTFVLALPAPPPAAARPWSDPGPSA